MPTSHINSTPGHSIGPLKTILGSASSLLLCSFFWIKGNYYCLDFSPIRSEKIALWSLLLGREEEQECHKAWAVALLESWADFVWISQRLGSHIITVLWRHQASTGTLSEANATEHVQTIMSDYINPFQILGLKMPHERPHRSTLIS